MMSLRFLVEPKKAYNSTDVPTNFQPSMLKIEPVISATSPDKSKDC